MRWKLKTRAWKLRNEQRALKHVPLAGSLAAV